MDVSAQPTVLVQILQVALPALGALFAGVVALLLTLLKRALDKNTAETVAAKVGIEANSADQSRGFKEQGQWRYATDARLRVLEETLSHVTRRVERIPTESQVGYKRPVK